MFFIAASYTAHVHFFSCVYMLLVVIIVCITLLNMLPLIFFSLNVEVSEMSVVKRSEFV